MKAYFIGLGGCGLQTVSELSKRLSREKDYEKDYAFTYIDTDMNTLNSINTPDIVIPTADFIDLGNTVPLAIYNYAKDTDRPTADTKRLLEWVIDQKPGHMILPNKPLSDGAQAQRNVGRFGIYQFYNAIENELKTKIGRFAELKPGSDGRKDVDIWVVASSCGGTGSSLTMDVLYLLNRIAFPVANGEPNVKLVLYMPQTFVDANATNANHKLNGYACMEEINFFRSNFENNKRQTFEPYAVRPTRLGESVMDFPLFQFLIPVCAENNMGSKMKLDQFYPTVAEMIYYLNTGKGRDFVKSQLSNILAELLQQPDRVPDVTSQMIGYGFRAVKKANKELKEYLIRRALYEVVNFGLLDKRQPADFEQLKIDFANNAILKKLISLAASIQDTNRKYDYNYAAEDDSVEALVKQHIAGNIRYDAGSVSDQVVIAMSKRLEDLFYGEDFADIKDAVRLRIMNEIDHRLNEFILTYGLNHAYDLLNTVDDYYLEPLLRYIKSTLLPDANAKVNSTRNACAVFAKGGLFQAFKKTEMDQSIQQYKNAVAHAVALKLSMQILQELTEAPAGYLEKLRKGDSNNAGIHNLRKALENNGADFKESYDNLAKAFQATADDVMTVYLPSLAALATGENNTYWAADNVFDDLYQQSVLEQEEVDLGLEKRYVPVRTSVHSRGLKDILGGIDINNDLFIRIIKDKRNNLDINKDSKIIAAIRKAVEDLVNIPGTAAADWLAQSVSTALHNPAMLPKDFRNKEELFNSFKDVNRVPVFFPVRNDMSMPKNMRLMFVGADEELAVALGFNKDNKEQTFVEDKTMEDRFMVMRMPAGLEFMMYKYYPAYQTFFSSAAINQKVRSKFYGCYLHQAFNEYGLTPALAESRRQPDMSVSDQLAKQRLEALVKVLYYQHVTGLIRERDKSAYNNLFGAETAASAFGFAGMTPEEMEMFGIKPEEEKATEAKPDKFIDLAFDLAKKSILLQLRPVRVNPTTKYLEIDDAAPVAFEFDTEHTVQCKPFAEYLLSLPEELFSVAGLLDQRFVAKENEKLYQALKAVEEEAKKRLLNAKDANGVWRFASCCAWWKNNDASSEGKQFLGIIMDALNAL